MSAEFDPLRVLGGMLLFLFGICLTLTGGLCSYFVLAIPGLGANAFFFGALSFGTLALGIFAVVRGVRIMANR